MAKRRLTTSKKPLETVTLTRGKAVAIPSALALLLTAILAATTLAADQPQWGRSWSRNMVSDEVNLPESFDPETGENIKWSAPLGSHAYATPVVANGRVFIGANNALPRDPRHQGIRGVLLCLDEATGKLCWQLVVPKFENTIYLDWGPGGICSPATVEGDRVYVVTNRAEVVCLDLDGMADGNDGPYRDEGRLMARPGQSPMKVTDIDADVLWLFDMPAEIGMHHHDSAHSSILIHGDYLYLNTGNGVNRTHTGIPAPDAPSLIVLNKNTGRLVAQDGERIGPRIFHCTWSSPSLGVVDGRPLIFFGGGDGVCYAFKAIEPAAARIDPVRILQRVWRFDCDPTSPKENVHRYMRNRSTSPSNIKGMPVFHQNRVYVAVGGDIWWGKNRAWLKCIDATRTGDITHDGTLWSYPLNRHCCTTPAVYNGLVFLGDLGRTLHCLDAKTGRPHWIHETSGEIWASTLIADGKVFVGTSRREFLILAADKTKRLIASIDLDDAVYGTPVAANGILYVSTMTTLYAVGKESAASTRTREAKQHGVEDTTRE